jgi:hypothetical protein
LDKKELPFLPISDPLAILYHRQKQYNPNKKYEDCLFLVDMCIKEKDPIKATELFDSVIRYARQVLPEPNPINKKENKCVVRQVLDGLLSQTELREIPPKVNDEVYVLFLVRLILRNSHTLVPLQSQEFEWFHNNYGPLMR